MQPCVRVVPAFAEPTCLSPVRGQCGLEAHLGAADRAAQTHPFIEQLTDGDALPCDVGLDLEHRGAERSGCNWLRAEERPGPTDLFLGEAVVTAE